MSCDMFGLFGVYMLDLVVTFQKECDILSGVTF